MAGHAIWKFPLRPLSIQQVDMPRGARLLTVQLQADQPVLWALVEPAAQVVPRMISLVATGQPLGGNSNAPYLGTVQMDALVWHFFDGGEDE